MHFSEPHFLRLFVFGRKWSTDAMELRGRLYLVANVNSLDRWPLLHEPCISEPTFKLLVEHIATYRDYFFMVSVVAFLSNQLQILGVLPIAAAQAYAHTCIYSFFWFSFEQREFDKRHIR